MRNTIISLVLLLVCIINTTQAQEPAGQFPFTSVRPVTPEDIEGKTLADLKIMRNEIFARHGHTFKSEDLRKHFESQTWYSATLADASSLLTPLEKQNVDFIKKWETRIATTSDFDSFYELFTKAVANGDVAKLSELVHIDYFFTSKEDFISRYKDVEDEIREAVQNNTPRPRGNDEFDLFYGEFYSDVQYKWVEITKIGCCWYIHAFQRAG